MMEIEASGVQAGNVHGKLTIFASYLSGAGKTYAMLRAAEEARGSGRDVAIGLLSCDSWPETASLAVGFETLPCRTVIQYLFPVGVIYFDILAPAVTGISHCKMRSHLLCDQDRQLLLYAVLPGSRISGGIGPDGKFPQRQGGMPVQHILPNIGLVLQLPGEIRTAVIFHHPVGELQLQILVLQFIQVHAAYMEHPFRPLQDRGGKHLSHSLWKAFHNLCYAKLIVMQSQFRIPFKTQESGTFYFA